MSTRRKTQSNRRAVNKLRTMSGSSQAESERDSGFSDTSSESTSTRGTTEPEDPTLCAPQQGATLGSGSVLAQLAVVGGSSYPNMIIMNNVLLKQSSDAPKPLKPWGFRPAAEGVLPVVPPPQVVFIQPMLSHPTPPPHKEPHSPRHRRPKKYLPVLKSYPRIAPHPGDSSSSSLGSSGTASPSSASSMSSSSSSSSRSKRSTLMTSGHREHSHRGKRHHQKKKSQSGGGSPPSGSTAIPPASPSALSQKPLPSVESEQLAPVVTVPPTSETRESPPVVPTTLKTQTLPVAPTTLQTQTWPVAPTTLQTQTTTVAPTTLQTQTTQVAPTTLQTQTVTSCDPKPAGPGADPDPETKRMRFCNTYNILSESGLLDITLKTKELQRQNRHTQDELDRLKEHTELFVQALLSGDPGVVLKLQSRLQEEEEEEEEDAERGGDTGECDAA